MDHQLERLLPHFAPEAHPLLELAHRIGPAHFAAVLRWGNGEKRHLPTLASFVAQLERALRDERLRGRFRGNNYAELAEDFGLSERRVREIVHADTPRLLAGAGTDETSGGLAA